MILHRIGNYQEDKKNPPWITEGIKHMITRRNKIARKLSLCQPDSCQLLWDDFKTLKRKIKSQTRAEAKKYGAKKLTEQNHGDIWKFIKEISFTKAKSADRIPIESNA